MMARNTCQLHSTFTQKDSSDEDSDLESLDSSIGPFAAIPKEFRPLPNRLKSEHTTKSLNENKQFLSNQKPTPVSKNTGENPLPKILEHPKRHLKEHKKLPDQTSDINSNFSKQPVNIQKCHQVPYGNVPTQNQANVKNNSCVNRETYPKQTTNGLSQTRNAVMCKKEPEYVNGIKFEYVEKQQHRTVKLNFEMPRRQNPLSDDWLDSKQENQMQPKQNGFHKANRRFHNGVERNFRKDTNAVLRRENIKWISPLNRDNEKVNKQDFRKVPDTLSYERNVVKWKSSLNLCDSNSETKDKIEWTVIHENKITVSAKKIEAKEFISKQTNDQCLPTKPCPQNRPKKYRKYYRKNNFNHKKQFPKHDSPGNKDTEKTVHKNDLQLNNNFKRENTENRNSQVQKECNLDSEALTPRHGVNKENFDSQKDNNKPELMANANENVKIHNPEPNFYPQKINKPELMANASENIEIHNPEPNFYPQKINNDNEKLIEDRKESILYYGREMSDFIIGSHSALSLFISMFNEWRRFRYDLIGHFEFLKTKMEESSKKFTKYKDLLDMATKGATIASAIPVPHVSIAAKVISAITSLISGFIKVTEKKKTEVEDSNDISIAVSRDTDASRELYLYALQCGQTFEETAKLIEEFHSNAGDPAIFEKDSPEIATFLRGVLEYRPRHRIFYKKLHKCFQELLHNSTSDFGKRFCEPFSLYPPTAIDVIGFLDWRFRHEDFNGESVRFELEQIENLIICNDTTIKELAIRVQNCVKILQDELKFLEGCVKSISVLFDSSVQFEIKERWF